MKKLPIILLAGAACLVNHCTAQTQKILADKIVAHIGNKIVLQSDIENAEFEYTRQGLEMPPNAACRFLEGQLVQKALVLQANKDSVTVSDDELDAIVDKQLNIWMSQFRDDEGPAGVKTAVHINQELRQLIKERKLADEMRNKITGNIKITPAEVKAYFDNIQTDSLPHYEATYEINELVVYPNANKDVEDYATNQLLAWKQQVETGSKKFDALAKLYSQDPGSRGQGGIYNLNKNDKQWDPTWFAAIWKLKDGQVSPVIKSRFGLHIIQMVSRAGDDAVVRHIMLTPQATNDELTQSTALLDSIRTQVLAGHINFAAAVNKFSQDESSRNNAGRITAPDGSTNVRLDDVDKDVAAVAKTTQPGDISKPLVFKDDRGRTAVRLIYMAAKTNAHIESLQTDYTKIAARALEQKKTAVLQQWLKQHIQDFSVSVDNAYADCGNVINLINAQ